MGYLTDQAIDLQDLISSVMRASDGALAVFAGVVRDHHEGRAVESIFYEAYAPMAEKEMGRIVAEVEATNPAVRVAVRHRLGLLKVGETSIGIACSSPHRAEAFAACRELIDRIKKTVPIWKKEKTIDGEVWVGWQGSPTEGGADSPSTHKVTSAQLPSGAGSARGEVPIVPAASTIVLRNHPLEVLLMRRRDTSSFVPGAWVFPGGAVESSDRLMAESMNSQDSLELRTMKICAFRELFEECGLWPGGEFPDAFGRRRALLRKEKSFAEIAGEDPLSLRELVWTARWITPEGVPKRFDTYFFLVGVSRTAEVAPDQQEAMELLWISPSAALEREAAGTLKLVFPTIKNLEAIAAARSWQELLASRRGVTIRTTRPILIVEGSEKRIVLPAESAES